MLGILASSTQPGMAVNVSVGQSRRAAAHQGVADHVDDEAAGRRFDHRVDLLAQKDVLRGLVAVDDGHLTVVARCLHQLVQRLVHRSDAAARAQHSEVFCPRRDMEP